ncbi:MAG TPA: LLM class flavin-dependent oxidoreductase [Candidatus Limnocylindria bacterium]|jgi:alkanesulfonate monooxygenase SsuD/methylene tetrahydromethanopterin reductase-like flavin-dependent oxidoreductase (luciferase family)|nr:LLM class flavin-dependent oxidoreductase [Candidatus Limnocylindria bacterium]
MATRFGLLLPHFGIEADQDLLVESARLAERLGFDSLWVRDHLVFHPHGMEGTDRTFIEPFVTLTFVASVTERVSLGAATIIPFRHPILMAYSVASLSWATRRKFDLGIGSGNFQHEFDVIGQGTVDRVAMMKEQVLIARRLWAGETLEWHSERYDFADVDLKPRPLFPVPVWWGGATPASARLAVDFCQGWLPGRITFPTYATRVAKIRGMCEKQGKPMIMTGAVPVTSIDITRSAAVERLNVPGLIKNANAQKFWLKPESGEFTRIEELDGSILAGTPDDIVRGIERYQEIGCDLLIFDFRMRFPDLLEQMETLARDILPRVSGTARSARLQAQPERSAR